MEVIEFRKFNFFKAKSFTLIEVLVGVMVFAILSLCVGNILVSGIKIYKKAQSMNKRDGMISLTLERIYQDLLSRVDEPVAGFYRNDSEFSFVSLNPSGRLQKITYFLTPSRSLFRRKEDFASFLSGENNFSDSELLKEVEEVEYEFYYLDLQTNQYLWKKTWEKSEGFPSGVRVRILEEEREFNRTILRTE